MKAIFTVYENGIADLNATSFEEFMCIATAITEVSKANKELEVAIEIAEKQEEEEEEEE